MQALARAACVPQAVCAGAQSSRSRSHYALPARAPFHSQKAACARLPGRAASIEPLRRCRRDLKAARAASVATCALSADDLNAKYGIKDSIKFETNEHGLVKAVLTHFNGSSAEVYLFGAHVTSYCQPSGDEVLFIRPDAKLDGSRPIAGGVPLCFPQFGPGEMQQHGFARNVEWEVTGTSADVNPDYPEPAVMLKLTDNEYTLGMWPHAFEATFEARRSVTLRSGRLKLELKVLNSGDQPLGFTAALHTYLEVVDVGVPAVRVTGLQGKKYLDKVPDPKKPEEKVEEAEAVTFGTALVDRMYLDTDAEAILEVGTGAGVVVENTYGFRDHVIWNPHETLKDCYQRFVCVESARLKPVTLAPGFVWTGEANITVIDL